MTTTWLLDCLQCEAAVTLDNVLERPRKVGNIVFVRAACPRCSVAYRMQYTPPQWEQLMSTTPKELQVLAVEIGKTVAAFRLVDLANVETVADIEPFWVEPFDERLRHGA